MYHKLISFESSSEGRPLHLIGELYQNKSSRLMSNNRALSRAYLNDEPLYRHRFAPFLTSECCHTRLMRSFLGPAASLLVTVCCLVVAQSFSFSPLPIFGLRPPTLSPACRARPSTHIGPVCGDRRSVPARPSFRNDPPPTPSQAGVTNAALKTAVYKAKRD